MEPITLQEILTAVGGRLLGTFQDTTVTVTTVETDSRTITQGALFLPLVGERFDGHTDLASALSKGAVGCITQQEQECYQEDKFYIHVADTQQALWDLAYYYKSKFPIPVVAITGSVGKTTTKDMVASVLSTKYRVHKTQGNFNNQVGVPLTIFQLNSSHQVAVLELGMNRKGEIDYLSKLVEPDVALITNVGDSHIEYFGSREGILATKAEIFNYAKSDALVVLNGDDPLLRTLSLPQNIAWCGKGEDNQYRATHLEGDGKSFLTCQATTPEGAYGVKIPALGDHMIYPTMMAAAVASHMGLTQEEIVAGVLQFAPTKMRMNIHNQRDGITILDDAYNANPQSMGAAAQVLGQSGAKRKIAVLGDMFELGELAPTLHTGVGEVLGTTEIDCLVAVGEMAAYIATAAQKSGVPEVHHCATKEEAMPLLTKLAVPESTILVKASRGMAFEELVNHLKSVTA